MDNLYYLIIIFTLMIFSFYFVSIEKKKTLKHITKYFKQTIGYYGGFRKIKYDKYNQVKEFILNTIMIQLKIVELSEVQIILCTFSDSEYLKSSEKIKLKEQQLAQANQNNSKSNNVEVDENEETEEKFELERNCIPK